MPLLGAQYLPSLPPSAMLLLRCLAPYETMSLGAGVREWALICIAHHHHTASLRKRRPWLSAVVDTCLTTGSLGKNVYIHVYIFIISFTIIKDV